MIQVLDLTFLIIGEIQLTNGLYANIHKKRARIKDGSGETMKKKGKKGRPSAMNFRQAALTAKNRGI